MEIQDLLESLALRKVRYLLCGGLAVNIYEVSRSTADIDVVMDFEEKNVASFLSAVKILNYFMHSPSGWKN